MNTNTELQRRVSELERRIKKLERIAQLPSESTLSQVIETVNKITNSIKRK